MGLRTEGLKIGYGAAVLLEDINVELPARAITLLIGENGCGKSTFLRTLSGVQKPLSGQIFYDEDEIGSISVQELAQRRAMVLTDQVGCGGFKVNELVAIGRHRFSDFFGRLSPTDKSEIDNAIEMVGLSAKAHNFISELSDGERQKAMIARAIAQQTEVIILDEPTSFLDISSRFEIMNLLEQLSKSYGKTILLSSHDVAAAMPKSDNIWAITTDGSWFSDTKENAINSGVLNKIFRGVTFDAASLDFRAGS